MLDGVDTEAIHVSFADPVAVSFDEGVDDIRADGVIIIGVVLETIHVTVLVLGIGVVVTHLPATVVPVLVAELDRNGTIIAPEISEIELSIVRIEVTELARIKPVIARMIDHDIEDDADRKRMPFLFKAVSRLDEFDEVLLRPEMWIDPQVVTDVVAMIGVCIVLKNRRKPDGGAPKAGNITEVPGDALYGTAVEGVRCGDALGSICSRRN